VKFRWCPGTGEQQRWKATSEAVRAAEQNTPFQPLPDIPMPLPMLHIPHDTSKRKRILSQSERD